MDRQERPTRDQVIDSIMELTPHEIDRSLAIEAELKKPSNWKVRDAIRNFCDDIDGSTASMVEDLNGREWLHLAWTLIEVQKDIVKLLNSIETIDKGKSA